MRLGGMWATFRTQSITASASFKRPGSEGVPVDYKAGYKVRWRKHSAGGYIRTAMAFTTYFPEATVVKCEDKDLVGSCRSVHAILVGAPSLGNGGSILTFWHDAATLGHEYSRHGLLGR